MVLWLNVAVATLTVGAATAICLTPPAGARGPANGDAAARGVAVAAGRAAKAGVDWSACPPEWRLDNALQCGHVTVPIDYARPDGPTIRLALDRFRSVGAPERRQGSLLFNPGGPGGSGIEMLRSLRPQVWTNVVRAYDLVGFDPRGVGRSAPLSCADPREFAKAPKPDPVPDGAAGKEALRVRAARYARDCRERNGTLLPHVHTLNTARDLDVIRAALGERKLNYVGVSYGTYLGAVYGTLFPGRVRRMVVDSIVDPSPSGIWYGQHQRQAPAFERRFTDWKRWVAGYDGTYHLGNTAAEVGRRWERLRAAVGRDAIGGVVGPAELTEYVQNVVLYDSSWASVADAWSRYAAGDPDGLVEAAGPDMSDTARNTARENFMAGYRAINCADAPWPAGWSRWDRDATRLHREAPFIAWFSVDMNLPCATWATPRQAPVDVRTRAGLPPVLLVQDEGDAATPYAGAVELHRRFTNSRLVTVRDAGAHGVTNEVNPCVNRRVDAYLLDGATDATDVTCAPPAPPRPTPPGGRG